MPKISVDVALLFCLWSVDFRLRKWVTLGARAKDFTSINGNQNILCRLFYIPINVLFRGNR